MYLATSIKYYTKEKRGKGTQKKVGPYAFFSIKFASIYCLEGKEVFTTAGTSAVIMMSKYGMLQLDNWLTDTQLLIHVQNVLVRGSITCLIYSADTDVLLFLIGNFMSVSFLYPAADI